MKWEKRHLNGDNYFEKCHLGRPVTGVNGGKMCFMALLISHFNMKCAILKPGRVAQLVGHLTRKSGVLASIPGLATYFRFSFRFFKKGSCQLLAKVCARSTG